MKISPTDQTQQVQLKHQLHFHQTVAFLIPLRHEQQGEKKSPAGEL